MGRFGGSTASTLIGLGCVVAYCLLSTSADAITRIVAQGYAAPQLYALSGGTVMFLSWMTNRLGHNGRSLRCKRPKTLALRSACFTMSCGLYFVAFRDLQFAEVFLFIALVPIFAAAFSGPVLGEPLRLQSWAALFAGLGGMLLLQTQSLSGMNWAHVCAFFGAFFGALSMVLARDISRDDSNALVQVFYPNAMLCALMTILMPLVYKPMDAASLGLVLAYASLLFLARWVLVIALARIMAYVVTPLMNMQFVVMIVFGAVLFGEMPSLNLIAGVVVVILAGSYLFAEQLFCERRSKSPAADPSRNYLPAVGNSAGSTSKS